MSKKEKKVIGVDICGICEEEENEITNRCTNCDMWICRDCFNQLDRESCPKCPGMFYE